MRREKRERNMSSFENEFPVLRKKLAAYLQDCFENEAYGKWYEGTWTVASIFPDVYQDPKGELPPESYVIKLDCYLVGPHRHYEWEGKTLDDAFDRCKKQVEIWIGDDGYDN